MNFDPTPEDAVWWDQQYASLTSVDGGVGIDVPSRKSYKEYYKPSNSNVQMFTLERALRSQHDFAQWHPQRSRDLTVIGLPTHGSKQPTCHLNVRSICYIVIVVGLCRALLAKRRAHTKHKRTYA